MCMAVGGIISGASKILNTGTKSIEAYGEAQAHNLSVRFNANQLNRNAEIARMQAGEAIEAGQEKIGEWRRGVKQTIGAQKAAAASAGVMVGTGSIGAVEQATKLQGNIGMERLRISAYREAWYLKMMALQYSTQAKMLRATKVNPLFAMHSVWHSLGAKAGANITASIMAGGPNAPLTIKTPQSANDYESR